MKIVTSPTDGNERFVLQESLDHHHRRSTVEDERSKDGDGHVMLQPKIEFDDLPVQDPILQPEMDEFLANANHDDSQIDNYSSDTDSSSSDSSYSSSSESEAESSDSDSSDWSVESSSSSDSSTVVQKSKTTRKRKRLVETAKQREERLRKRRKHARRQRAAMTPEELEKYREKRRAVNRASKLRMRLKKANELQKGLKDSEGQKLKRPVAQIPTGKLEAKQVVQQKRKKPLAQMSIEELEKRRRAERVRKRNRLARITEQERQAHREKIREYDRLWREKKMKAVHSYKNASSSKLWENDELPLRKQKENHKPQIDSTVYLFEARRLRNNTQTRMRRIAQLRSETPEQREERLRKRREQARKRKEKILQARTDQSETEDHFTGQMASMITSQQLTEVDGNRKRQQRNGGDDDDDRATLPDGVPKRARLSLVDYSDSDDSID